jgi:hypothetical protein
MYVLAKGINWRTACFVKLFYFEAEALFSSFIYSSESDISNLESSKLKIILIDVHKININNKNRIVIF